VISRKTRKVLELLATAGFGAAAVHLEATEGRPAHVRVGDAAVDVELPQTNFASAHSMLTGLREETPPVSADTRSLSSGGASSKATT
jgi:hypothetical protein